MKRKVKVTKYLFIRNQISLSCCVKYFANAVREPQLLNEIVRHVDARRGLGGDARPRPRL